MKRLLSLIIMTVSLVGNSIVLAEPTHSKVCNSPHHHTQSEENNNKGDSTTTLLTTLGNSFMQIKAMSSPALQPYLNPMGTSAVPSIIGSQLMNFNSQRESSSSFNTALMQLGAQFWILNSQENQTKKIERQREREAKLYFNHFPGSNFNRSISSNSSLNGPIAYPPTGADAMLSYMNGQFPQIDSNGNMSTKMPGAQAMNQPTKILLPAYGNKPLTVGQYIQHFGKTPPREVLAIRVDDTADANESNYQALSRVQQDTNRLQSELSVALVDLKRKKSAMKLSNVGMAELMESYRAERQGLSEHQIALKRVLQLKEQIAKNNEKISTMYDSIKQNEKDRARENLDTNKNKITIVKKSLTESTDRYNHYREEFIKQSRVLREVEVQYQQTRESAKTTTHDDTYIQLFNQAEKQVTSVSTTTNEMRELMKKLEVERKSIQTLRNEERILSRNIQLAEANERSASVDYSTLLFDRSSKPTSYYNRLNDSIVLSDAIAVPLHDSIMLAYASNAYALNQEETFLTLKPNWEETLNDQIHYHESKIADNKKRLRLFETSFLEKLSTYRKNYILNFTNMDAIFEDLENFQKMSAQFIGMRYKLLDENVKIIKHPRIYQEKKIRLMGENDKWNERYGEVVDEALTSEVVLTELIAVQNDIYIEESQFNDNVETVLKDLKEQIPPQ